MIRVLLRSLLVCLFSLLAPPLWAQNEGADQALQQGDGPATEGDQPSQPPQSSDPPSADQPPQTPDQLENADRPRASAADAEARAHFDNGVRLVRREHWGPALAQFDASLSVAPSRAALRNRALCLQNLHRYAEAADAFERYLDFGGDTIEETERARIRARVEEIRSLLTPVQVEVNVDGAIIAIDGRPVGQSPLSEPLLLISGVHEMEVSQEGYQRDLRTVPVVVGEALNVVVELVPETQMGMLRLESSLAGAEITIDGYDVGHMPYAGVLQAGSHEVVVSAPGYRTARRMVDIVADQDQTVMMSIERHLRIAPPWFWSALGLATASLVTLVGLGVAVHVGDSRYDPALDDAEVRFARGQHLVVAADVFLGLTFAFAAAALATGLLTDWEHEEP